MRSSAAASLRQVRCTEVALPLHHCLEGTAFTEAFTVSGKSRSRCATQYRGTSMFATALVSDACMTATPMCDAAIQVDEALFYSMRQCGSSRPGLS